MILLKREREKKKMSQAELASLSGVRQQSISAYERGAMIPGANALYMLATALGCTMDELYRPDSLIDQDDEVEG